MNQQELLDLIRDLTALPGDPAVNRLLLLIWPKR